MQYSSQLAQRAFGFNVNGKLKQAFRSRTVVKVVRRVDWLSSVGWDCLFDTENKLRIKVVLHYYSKSIL